MVSIWSRDIFNGDRRELIEEILRELAGRTRAFDADAATWMSAILLEGYLAELTPARLAKSLRDDPRCASAIHRATKPEVTEVLAAIVERPQRTVSNIQMILLARQTGSELVLLRGKAFCRASDAHYGRRLDAQTCPLPPFDGCDVLNCKCGLSRPPNG